MSEKIEAILTQLKKPVEPNLIKQREGWRDRQGNTHYVDYVEWHTVADILDEHASNWSHHICNVAQIGDIITVTAAITIEGIKREGVGTGTADSELGIKKAEHDALKRAAVKFGVGREVYKKETEVIERGGSHQQGTVPSNPFPGNDYDLVTAKQLGMIRAVAREKNLDPQDICSTLWDGAMVEDLSKRAASHLIKELQEHRMENNTPDVPDNSNLVENSPAERADLSGFSPAEQNQIETWREKMKTELGGVGIKPDVWLAGFDSRCPTMEKREFAFNETMRAVWVRKKQKIKTAYADSGWDGFEIERDMKNFGIENGLEKATAEQIEGLYADMVKARMIN